MIEAKIGSRKVWIRTPGEIQALRDANIQVAVHKIMAAAAIEYAQYDAEIARRDRVAKRGHR